MIYYCKKTEDGSIVGVGVAPDAAAIPEGHEKCGKDVRDAWLKERQAEWAVREAAQAAAPTQAERLRADMDFLAAMTGVSL